MTNLQELASSNIQAFRESAVGSAEPLKDSFAQAESDPKLLFRTFYSYYRAIRDLFNLTPDEIAIIKKVNSELGSKRGADEFLTVFGDQKDAILAQLRQIGNLDNPHNQTGISELARMMNNAWTIKQQYPDWTPKDGDPRADNVIWGFVKGSTQATINIHFAICHGIERILTTYLPEIDYAKHKDWLLCALNDVIALKGLKGNTTEAQLLSLWTKPRPEGLGWISPRRLDAYKTE